MKICTTCGVCWPFTDFTQNGKLPDGSPRLRPSCKLCNRLIRQAAYQVRKSEPLGVTCTEKTCTKCLTIKPSASFFRSLLTRDRLQSWCRTCSNTRALEAYHAKRAKAV